ncbi:MAG: Rrf2 family transcriptional regulator [Desulfotomaculum sp.]|nr:Rrf2 family transcriptional regulator [Desulfotomaculum sp.]
MRFNQATDYAFRTIFYLSRQEPNEIVEAKQIAEKENIPIRFLLKTVRLLTQAGIVNSYRGLKGGYALAKDPKDITLRDIVEAVEGPVLINKCLGDPKECSKDAASWCPVRRALYRVQQAANKELGKYTFNDLIKIYETECKKQ